MEINQEAKLKTTEFYTKAEQEVLFKTALKHEKNGLTSEAAQLYEFLANYGHTKAQYKFAVCLYFGMGIKQDEERAILLLKIVASTGYARAQVQLGLHYQQEGKHEQAIENFLKAANQGNAEGQYHLGICYFEGDGVEEDHEEGVRYCTMAAKQGSVLAMWRLIDCYKQGDGVEKDLKEAKKWSMLIEKNMRFLSQPKPALVAKNKYGFHAVKDMKPLPSQKPGLEYPPKGKLIL